MTTTRPISLRSDSIEVGNTYDFEIYKNGTREVVLRKPAVVLSKPDYHVRDMGENDSVMLQVEGEEEPRRLFRNNHHPYFLVTRMDDKCNCRVRFHSLLAKAPVPVMEEVVSEEKEAAVA